MQNPSRAAVILCGGRSTRMGAAKAMLPFGKETMLQRVVNRLSEIVSQIVVVAAHEQELPKLPSEIIVARDRKPNQGPLEGIAAGLMALQNDAEVYITSCDVPRLQPALVGFLFEQLEAYDIVVPRDDTHFHPLAAVYRSSILPIVESLLEQDQRRPAFLFQQANTRVIDVEALRAVDPDLATLDNLNTPEDYQRALERENLAPATNRSAPHHDG